jgi:mRNA interferase MazF
LTDQNYNRGSGLMIVCPLASKRKHYPSALPVVLIEGAVLLDHLKSLDWEVRNASFHSKADPVLVSKVRTYVAVLLHLAGGRV